MSYSNALENESERHCKKRSYIIERYHKRMTHEYEYDVLVNPWSDRKTLIRRRRLYNVPC